MRTARAVKYKSDGKPQSIKLGTIESIRAEEMICQDTIQKTKERRRIRKWS